MVRFAAPDGWSESTSPTGRCFRDLPATRWLGVATWVPAAQEPGADPLGHVSVREQELLRTDPLPGYQKLRIAAVPYFAGGAEWEFAYDDRARGRMHGVVRDFLVAPGHGYTIVWCTTDFDWTVNLDNLRLVLASFTPQA